MFTSDHWKLQPDEMLVSFDVKSLFTSVPVDEALKAVEKRLAADSDLEDRSGFSCDTVMSMLNLCLSARQFQFRGKHYELSDGLAMGSQVSPPVANISWQISRRKHWSFSQANPRVSGFVMRMTSFR